MAFSRALVRRVSARDRLARIAAVFTFVSHLVDVPRSPDGRPRDGVDLIVALTGTAQGPSVILAAMLLALGERARLDYARGTAFVRVELDLADLARLPPHAGLMIRGGRCYLPLDARRSRSPLGFLPWALRDRLRWGYAGGVFFSSRTAPRSRIAS